MLLSNCHARGFSYHHPKDSFCLFSELFDLFLDFMISSFFYYCHILAEQILEKGAWQSHFDTVFSESIFTISSYETD